MEVEFSTVGNVRPVCTPMAVASVADNDKGPNIQGLHDHSGTLLHSAHWDESAIYKGKRVAVIGTGSSGIQVRVLRLASE